MKRMSWIVVLIWAGICQAQQPHEVAVLVNENSHGSKRIANIFSGIHGVTAKNLNYLDLPESKTSGRFECSPEEFKTLIYDPAQAQLKERGLDEQILAWAYSVDFPIRIVTAVSDRQQMSIMGLTFLRGEVPDLRAMETGKIISPLFAGPGPKGTQKLPSRSFSLFKAGMKDKFPLPSMMLGYTGPNGNTIETVVECMKRGVLARRTPKTAPVLYVKTEDAKRSAPREWQYDDALAEMTARGRTAQIVTNSVAAKEGLLGVMTGDAEIDPASFGTFAPGAMAEHLTSWSAEFQKGQSKCTDWLRAGATVTAGMVTEPYNHWIKFPHARFYGHYVAGCTAMESFYQSIASPVQVLLLGDPLSQIVSLPVQLNEIGLSKEISSSIDSAFVAEAKFPLKVEALYSALCDGISIKPMEKNSLIDLPYAELGDGWHEVRVIAQANLPVTPGGFKDIQLMINKKGRAVKISNLSEGADGDILVDIEVVTGDEPIAVTLLWNGQEIARKPLGQTLSFKETLVGEGPSRIQAAAIYDDGMHVRSAPTLFAIEFKDK